MSEEVEKLQNTIKEKEEEIQNLQVLVLSIVRMLDVYNLSRMEILTRFA